MSNALIYIDGQVVDIDPATNVAINLQVNNIAELKDRQQYFSNRFNGLFTENNHALFGYSNNPLTTNRITKNKIACTVHVAGDIYSGFLIVDKSTTVYELQFVGGNAAFFELIKDKRLSDLDLSDMDLNWDLATMWDLYSDSLADNIFVLTDDGNLPPLSRTVDVRNHYFQLRNKVLFRRIVEQAGFTLAGNITSNYRYDKAIIPFCNDYPKKDGSFTIEAYPLIDRDATLTAGQTSNIFLDDDGAVLGTDPSNQWDITGSNSSYIPTTGQYDPIFDIKVSLYTTFYTYAGSNNAVMVELIKEDSTGVNAIAVLGTVVPNSSGFASFTHKQQYSVASGDKYYLRYRITGININVKVKTYSGPNTFFKATVPDVLNFGELWQWKFNMPDLSQVDYLKAIMNITAAIVDTDVVNKIVRFETFNDIAADKVNAVNIDEFISLDRNQTPSQDHHPDTYAQKNWMRYAADDNVTDNIGDGYFTINDNTLIPEKDLFTLPFAGSDEATRLIGIKLAQVLRVKDGQTVKPKLRILLHGSSFPSNTTPITLTDGTGTSTQSSYLIGYFIGSDQTQNMGFNAHIKDDYRYIVSMLNDYSKMSIPMYFTPNFINQFDPFKLWYSHRYACYLWVNRISNYISGKKCSAEVVKL